MDGYVLIAINSDDSKRHVKEIVGFDMRLDSYFSDYARESEIQDHFSQLNSIEKDCLVMVFFNYKSVGGGRSYFDDDYEDHYNYVSHVIVKQNYKEFWKGQLDLISDLIGSRNLFDESFDPQDNEEIDEWSEFYDEYYVFVDKNLKKQIMEKLHWRLIGNE